MAGRNVGPDSNTATRSISVVTAGGEIRAPCLTIAYHPRLERIGERAVLKDLVTTGTAALSRAEPLFESPEGAARALEDPYVSRRPCALALDRDGALSIDPGGSRNAVELDGVGITERCRVPPDRHRRGLFIGLRGRVILHLGTIKLPVRRSGPQFGLVGESEALIDAREGMSKVAPLDDAVLILGESGTGKELVARGIHDQSRRRDGRFVALNMSAIPPAIAASLLFGHDKGAFTGAGESRDGYFVEANGGTLFLDEIGATPFEVQVMLLRALEDHEVRALGAKRPRKVDVRVISATDTDLAAAVQSGRFSEALYNRLGGFVIRLPALRERREDIGRLVAHFLRQELAATGDQARLEAASADQPPYLSASLMSRLLLPPWRGNVRRLQRVVRQMVIGSRGESQLRLADELVADVAPPAASEPSSDAPSETADRAFQPLTREEKEERARIVRALADRAGNQTRAAEDCGMSRNTFFARLKKYGIGRPRKAPD